MDTNGPGILAGCFLTRSREVAKGRAVPRRFFLATDWHGLTRIIAGGGFEPRMDTNGHE